MEDTNRLTMYSTMLQNKVNNSNIKGAEVEKLLERNVCHIENISEFQNSELILEVDVRVQKGGIESEPRFGTLIMKWIKVSFITEIFRLYVTEFRGYILFDIFIQLIGASETPGCIHIVSIFGTDFPNNLD